MVKRASKRAGGAKKAGKAKPAQPMLPNFVAGALAVVVAFIIVYRRRRKSAE